MKHQKSLALMIVLALVLSLAVVSAAFTVNPPSIILKTSDNSETFNVADATTGEGNIILNEGSTSLTIPDGGLNNLLVTLSTALITDGTASTDVTASYATIPTGFKTGVFSTSFKISDGVQPDSNVQVVFINQFCSSGTQGATDLELGIDVSNKGEGEDSDDFDWFPRDKIEIDVDFENDKDLDGVGDLEDVTFEIGLFEKSTGQNIAEDLEWESNDDEQREVGNVDEGDDAKHTFEFIVPNDIDAGDYTLMVKVYEEDAESTTCLDHDTSEDTYFYDVSIDRESNEDRWIVFEDIELDTTAPCGTEVTLTAKAYNIGEQDEQAVKILLKNTELGIDMSQIIDGIDMDESANVEFKFSIPSTAAEKTYTLSLYAKYDYDEDDDEDEEYPDDAFDEESEATKVYLTVEGNCVGTIDDIEINAADTKALNEAVVAYAGKEVVYTIPIKNTGTSDITLDLSVSGVSDWASADVVDSVTIAAGETENAEVTLDINSDASGEQKFTLEMTSGIKSKTQAVTLDVEQGGLFAGSVIGAHIKDNAFIYAVVVIDIILIVIIILAVRGMVKKRPGA